jgi:dipeptidyl aminopeptidase/acylaminoacyl peptidase
VLGLALLLQVQAARPIELEDFYRFQTVTEVAIAPDGKRVALVRSTVIEPENRRVRSIWLAPGDGSTPPTRLTADSLDATAPVFSPDGRTLAFRIRASGVPAIRFLDLDRPAAEPVAVAGLSEAPLFSPDGSWIAFVRPIAPPATPAPPATEFERKLAERFKGRIHETVQYRFDGQGYLPDRTSAAATPPAELFVMPRAGGEARQLTRLGVDVEEAAWSPDSKRLALVANLSARDEYTYERADLWIVDQGGSVKRLTDGGYHHDQVAWSPDGKMLVFRRQKGLSQIIAAKERQGSPIDLYLMPADGGPLRNLTADWDLIPDAPRFGPDGRRVYFSAERSGGVHLFRVDLTTGRVEQVTTGARQITSPSWSADFSRLAYVATDPTHPTEAWSAAPGGPEIRLSRFNDSLLAAVQLAPATRIQYPSRDGTPIEGWLMSPLRPGSTPYPLILSIHGGPHGAYGDEFSIPFQLLAAQGYAVLYTNPRGSTGYGEKFLWATWGAWGDLDGEDVLAGVDWVLARHPIDRRRLGVAGYSYGGFLTNWLVTHDRRFSAAISGAGIANWVSDYGTADIPRTKESEFFGPPWEKEGAERLLRQSPIMYAKGVTTPTLFIQGEADYRVPVEEGEQMYTALRKQRVAARMVRYPGMFHGGWTPWNTVHRYHEELGWWRRWLGARQVP